MQLIFIDRRAPFTAATFDSIPHCQSCLERTLTTIFGKTLSEYVSFAKPILLLIIVVGVVLSLAGVQNSAVKWLSILATLFIALMYLAIRVYTSGFGSYKRCPLGHYRPFWTN